MGQRTWKRPNPEQGQQIASWTYQWLHAADRQADRIDSAPDTGAGQVEILLFISALRNVVRGAEAILGPEHDAVVAFHRQVPNAAHIRDILEHFDDYLLGTGNLQRNRKHSLELLVHFSSGADDSDIPEIGERMIYINSLSLDVSTAISAVRPLASAALQTASCKPS